MSMFSSFASSFSGLKDVADAAVAHAQASLKTVESQIDHAMGIDENGNVIKATPPATVVKSEPSVSPASQQGMDVEKQQLLAKSTGDFFGSFLSNAAAVVAPVTSAASTTSSTTDTNASALPSFASIGSSLFGRATSALSAASSTGTQASQPSSKTASRSSSVSPSRRANIDLETVPAAPAEAASEAPASENVVTEEVEAAPAPAAAGTKKLRERKEKKPKKSLVAAALPDEEGENPSGDIPADTLPTTSVLASALKEDAAQPSVGAASGWNDGFDDWPPSPFTQSEAASKEDKAPKSSHSPTDPELVIDEEEVPASANQHHPDDDETVPQAAEEEVAVEEPAAEESRDEESAREEEEEAARQAKEREAEEAAAAAAEKEAQAAEAKAAAEMDRKKQEAADSAAAAVKAAEEERLAQEREIEEAVERERAAKAKARARKEEQKRKEEQEREKERERIQKEKEEEEKRIAAEKAEVEKKKAAEAAAAAKATAEAEAKAKAEKAAAEQERLEKEKQQQQQQKEKVKTPATSPLAVDVAPSSNQATPLATPNSTTATPSLPAASPSAAAIPATTPNGSTNPALLQAALERAAKAEEVAGKLTRLLKIRELQMEKHQLEQSHAQDEITRLTEKLTTTAGAVDRDRERLEKKYNELQKQLNEERAKVTALESDKVSGIRKANDSSEADKISLQHKDAQIAAVMAEGAKLQEKQQKLETIIKNLRKEIAGKDDTQKKLEHDRASSTTTLTDLTTKFSQLQEKYSLVKEDLQESNLKVMALEQKLADSDSIHTSSTNTLADLRYSLQHTQDALREKENEIIKLQHENVLQQKTKASSFEELESLKSKETVSLEREAALLRNISELQTMLQTERTAATAREEVLQSEMASARLKLQQAEARNEELISAVPAATRPLLRQIENLTASLHSSKDAWSSAESGLRQRLHEQELLNAKFKTEKERFEQQHHESALELEEKRSLYTILQDKHTALESAHRTLKKTHSTLEETHRELTVKSEETLHQLLTIQNDKEELKAKLKTMVENQSMGEKKMESLYLGEKSLRERVEQQLEHFKATANISVSTGASSAPTPSNAAQANGESGVESEPSTPAAGSGASSGLDSALLFGSDKLAVTSTVEMLRSLLQQKEGEIRSLKEINKSIEAGRASLSDELVLLTSQLNAASMQMAKLPALEQQLAAMSRRHDAACMIIGEKEEELEDLRADVAQAKQMFQQQISQLCNTIEELKKNQKPA